MSILETTTGGVVTRGSGTIDIAIYYRRSVQYKEQPLHLAERDPGAEVKSAGQVEVMQSCLVKGKFWSTKRNDFPDGSYLRVNVRKARPFTPGSTGFPVSMFNLMLAPRANGALVEIAIECPTDANATRSKIYITGRFDILTPEQVVERGVDIGANGSTDIMNYPELDDIDDIVEIMVKEKEVAPRSVAKAKVVTSASGEQKAVAKFVVKRRIGLRK